MGQEIALELSKIDKLNKQIEKVNITKREAEESFKDFMNGKICCHIDVTAIEEPKKCVYLTLKDISEGKGVGIDPDFIKIVQ